MRDDDPFATGAHLAKASKHDYLFAWRRFLGFLAIHEPDALELAPADRLTPDRVKAFRVHLAETNAPRSVAVIVDALYHAARLLMPEHDWAWLKAIKARLYRHAPSSRPTGPVITSVQLWDFGEQLMEEAKPQPATPIRMRDAVQYRDGLMIALAAFVPIRRRNVASLEIGRHLVREGDGWLVLVPAEESKTKISMPYLVPEFLEPYLALYLDIVRPTLLRRPTPALWVGSKGTGICYGAIGQIVSRRLTSHFGFRVTLHDVRDAAETTWAIFAPDQIGVASELLGHRDPRTGDKYYNRARGMEASRRYSQLIAGIRSKRKPPARS
jgi:integrase